MDEWTKAETGVGAAIAAGSHLEKGTWALLVQAANVILSIIIVFEGEDQRIVIVQWFSFINHAILSKIRASPIRLVRAVIIPALRDFGFE